MEKLGSFCRFRCEFEIFLILKTAIISSKKPTGKRINAMLSVSIILTYEVYQKFD